MAYDSLGNVLSTTDELSRVTTFEYDALNRQSKVTQPDPDDTGSLPAIETETFYDKVGNSIRPERQPALTSVKQAMPTTFRIVSLLPTVRTRLAQADSSLTAICSHSPR